MKPSFAMLAALLIVGGCVSQHVDLVQMDTAKVIAVATKEIEAKCADFDMPQYIPVSINFIRHGGYTNEGTIYITYWTKKSTKEQAQVNPVTHASVGIAYTHKTATIAFANDGHLQEQNCGEWPEFPELKQIWFSESTIVTTNRNYLSNITLHGSSHSLTP